MGIKKQQKQKELLNRNYVNIDYYKSLRLKIPITICTLMIGIVAIIISNSSKPFFKDLKMGLYSIISIIAVFGFLALYFVHKQYNDINRDINYLCDRLKMDGADFYKEGNSYRENKFHRAKGIFFLGYLAIVLFWGICFMSIGLIIQ